MTLHHYPKGIVASLLLLVVGYAGAHAQQTMRCPAMPASCTKVVTFYNNGPTAIYPVIQAGIQNPDPWLQALFHDISNSYAETHYSRVYINPVHGSPPGGAVSVTVPWYTRLNASANNTDLYADWRNGGRISLFDNPIVLTDEYTIDKANPLSVARGSPVVSCPACEQPLIIYSSTAAYPPNVPFQLLEYTFADVGTPDNGAPFVIDLNVGYNISYLDQIYLPVALEPCRTEPCSGPDPSAVGYLGTIKTVPGFRQLLSEFEATEGWPRYSDDLDDAAHPRLPGADNIFVDAASAQANPLYHSYFTPPGQSVKDMISQWAACTSSSANPVECPQFASYQTISKFFAANFNNYLTLNCSAKKTVYLIPPNLDEELSLLPYIYGWVPFNRGCGAGANALNPFAPNPWPPFDIAKNEYIQLQYNYNSVIGAQRFNPFVELVHSKDYLDANSYAFSIDDAAGFQSNPGEGLIIAIGGPAGLPNVTPVVLPADFSKDFEVDLGDTIALGRPLWTAYGVCKNDVDTMFPPLPPGANEDVPKIIVDTVLNMISPAHPCVVTITDALNRKYQFTINQAVPWPLHTSGVGFDPTVLSCPTGPDIVPAAAWCNEINELSTAEPRFALVTPPSVASTLGSGTGGRRRSGRGTGDRGQFEPRF